MPRVVKGLASKLSVLLLLALQGCGCDLVGCDDSLGVRLASMPAGAFQVELLVNGVVQPAPPEALCAGTGTCSQEIWFYNQSPDAVSVRVTTSAGTKLTQFTNIKYKAVYPNGRGCDAECITATVTAQLP